MQEWWLDEVAHAGEEHLDPAYVANYERKSGYDPAGDVAVLVRHGLGPHMTVVDLGAGPGTLALAVAPLCRRVIAVDVSAAMTALLRERVRHFGAGNVRIVEAGLLSYDHTGDAADVVFTRNALHQLPDFWKAIALQRMASMLRTGGILRLHDLVYDFEPSEAPERIEAWMAGAVTDPAAGYTPQELAAHVRTEFSTYTWLLEPMLERTGFEIVERAYRRSAYATYTCRRVA